MEAILKQGEQLATFNRSLAVKFNTVASKDYRITIEPLDHDKHLSMQERRTMFMWCGEIAAQVGRSKRCCIGEFKSDFLFKEIEHKEKHAVDKYLIDSIKEMVVPELKYVAMDQLIRTGWANHDEFHEALMQFQTWARTEAKLSITEPDKYRVAREAAIASGKLTKVKKG